MKSSSTRADFGANRRLFAQAGASLLKLCGWANAAGGSGWGSIDEATLATARGAWPSNKAICEPFSLSRAGRLVNALLTRTINGWGIDAQLRVVAF